MGDLSKVGCSPLWNTALQEHYFTGYREHLEAQDPKLSREESFRLASRYVSPPRIAPHVSGAAIDLTLVDSEGRPVGMGTPVNATPEDSAGACDFGAENISTEALSVRLVLRRVIGNGLPPTWQRFSPTRYSARGCVPQSGPFSKSGVSVTCWTLAG